jgi:thiamine-monophosphate kinase
MPGEFELIDWIRAQSNSPSAPGNVIVPPGDDMAVLRWAGEDLLLVGVDQALDGVHFDSRVHGPDAIGRKVMNRNLSDCAAMACLPVAAVATVALPHGFGLDAAKALYQGMRSAGDVFGCAIVGGDTASWDQNLAVTVTILGRSAGLGPITRSGARAGDGIYVTGPLGGSIVGRHMNFTPRVREARELAASKVINAMIDISDGLIRDLAQICEHSKVGATLSCGAIPIHADAEALSRRDGRTPLDHALRDGEDHELLFTAAATPPLGIRIGTITAERSIRDAERGVELAGGGWEHQF